MNHPAHGHLKPGDFIRDPLTGAYSRGLLDARLMEEVARAQREQGQLTVCLFDIDHFKSVNDAYGHARGDEVLVHLVQTVQAALRTSDVLFRYGGDEFVLLLPSTGRVQAEIVCQRLVQQVRSQVLEGTPPLKISISMGMAVFPEDASAARELLVVADERNYLAKRQGRDQFVSRSGGAREVDFDAQARPLERDHQLAMFHQFMHRLSGTGVFRVTGEQGSGRTFFLKRVQQDLQTRQFMVMHLQPTRQLQHRPYGVLQQLESLGLQLHPGANGISKQLAMQVKEQGQVGLAVLVEDITLLDWATRALLGRMLQDGSSLPMVLVYTQGVNETPPVFPTPGRNEVQVVLTPLSRHAVQVWMREVLRWEAPSSLIDWIFRTSQGLPGKVRLALQALLDQQLLQRREEGWHLDRNFSSAVVLETSDPSTTIPSLPVPTTHFFGRDREWNEVHALFEHRRLVTLVGPGGIGKTRLSIEVAELRQDQYEHGVWFVPLDSIQRADLVVSSIARTLGVREGRRPVMEDLKDHLARMSCLLVLDNFEQVIEAASVLEDLLSAAPGVQMLVTSREKLNISSEQVFVVPPLGMPEDGSITTEEDAYQYSALSLFIDRARAVMPGLHLTPSNLQAVQQICMQLDGLPLAIELAAASVDLFSPEELALELSQNRLALLTEGPRNFTDRQKTLRNTIDWSFRLLGDAERWVFERMAVFVGGWSFEAARAVCADFNVRYAGSGLSLQGTLMKLVAKSLVQFQRGQKRYSMLQTIREYGLEKLTHQPDRGLVQRAHALYFLNLGEEAEHYLVGDGQTEWLEQLQSNQGNLREALHWMLRSGETLWAMQLCSAIWKFWQFKTHHREGREWLKEVMGRARGLLLKFHVPEEHRTLKTLEARLQVAAGWLANDQADVAEAGILFQAGLAGFREVGDRRGIGLALQGTGEMAMHTGEYALAQEHFEESRQIMQELGDLEEYAWVTDHLGRCQQITGQLEAAEESFTLCIQLFRQIKQDWGESISTIHLADVLVRQTKFSRVLDLTLPWLQMQRDRKDTQGFVYALALGWTGEASFLMGHTEQARSYLQEAIETCNTSGFQLTRIPSVLGLLHVQAGEWQEACEVLGATWQMVRNFQDPARLLELLTPLVHFSVAREKPELAVRLLGSIDRVHEDFQIVPTPVDTFVMGPVVQHLQTLFSPERFQTLWQEGHQRSRAAVHQDIQILVHPS